MLCPPERRGIESDKVDHSGHRSIFIKLLKLRHIDRWDVEQIFIRFLELWLLPYIYTWMLKIGGNLDSCVVFFGSTAGCWSTVQSICLLVLETGAGFFVDRANTAMYRLLRLWLHFILTDTVELLLASYDDEWVRSFQELIFIQRFNLWCHLNIGILEEGTVTCRYKRIVFLLHWLMFVWILRWSLHLHPVSTEANHISIANIWLEALIIIVLEVENAAARVIFDDTGWLWRHRALWAAIFTAVISWILPHILHLKVIMLKWDNLLSTGHLVIILLSLVKFTRVRGLKTRLDVSVEAKVTLPAWIIVLGVSTISIVCSRPRIATPTSLTLQKLIGRYHLVLGALGNKMLGGTLLTMNINHARAILVDGAEILGTFELLFSALTAARFCFFPKHYSSVISILNLLNS